MVDRGLSPMDAAVELTDSYPPLQGGKGFDLTGIELEGFLDQFQAFEPAAFEAFLAALDRLAEDADAGERALTAARIRRLIALIFGV